MPTASFLTQGSSVTPATFYNTASISPTADRWLVVDSWSRRDTGTIPAPTVTGLSLSWTNEASVTGGTATHVLARRYAFTGASPGSGAITLTFGGANQDACAWGVYELSSDTDGSDPFVQTATTDQEAVGTSISVTLAAFADANNRPLIAACHRANEASTPEGGYTEIVDVTTAGPIEGLAVAYHPSATDTTVSYTWTTNSSNPSLAIASEMKQAVAGGAVLDPFGMSGFFGG